MKTASKTSAETLNGTAAEEQVACNLLPDFVAKCIEDRLSAKDPEPPESYDVAWYANYE